MSNIKAFNTITAQIQRELTENTMKATKEILAQTDSEIQGAKPMTKDDIIRMALEAELIYDEQCSSPWVENTNLTPFLERFAALVASAEREACAEIADRLPRIYRETEEAHYRLSPEPFKPSNFGFDFAELKQAEAITHAIRARGQA